jgi:hypothetical protein
MSNEIPVDTSTAPPQDFFKEYQKINMHNTAKKMIHGKENDLKWVALEKVHGANFCMIHDGTKIYCCRRNDILHEHETFYNFQMIRDKYKDQIAKLFALLAEPDRLASITGSNDSVLERIMVRHACRLTIHRFMESYSVESIHTRMYKIWDSYTYKRVYTIVPKSSFSRSMLPSKSQKTKIHNG